MFSDVYESDKNTLSLGVNHRNTDPLWLWNPEETSPGVQNRGISGPTKKTHVLQNIFKKNMEQKQKQKIFFDVYLFFFDIFRAGFHFHTVLMDPLHCMCL